MEPKPTIRRWAVIAMTMAALSATATASAFSDIRGVNGEREITALKIEGILSGVGDDRFDPNGPLTLAQGVALVLKGLDLQNPDEEHGGQKPWYAAALETAAQYRLPVDPVASPDARLTREQFARLLSEAVSLKGPFAHIMIYLTFADEDQVDPNAMGSVQLLLISKIADLDAQKRFRPKDTITRAEAAVWLYRAREFVRNNRPVSEDGQTAAKGQEVRLIVENINDEVDRVTIDWGLKPNPGYGVRITAVEFPENRKAVVRYRLLEPDPDRFYAQVVVEAKSVTYVPHGFEVVAKPAD